MGLIYQRGEALKDGTITSTVAGQILQRKGILVRRAVAGDKIRNTV